jgi:hypothetical protein
MSSRIIIDNWSLQHVAELLGDGASRDKASVIGISGDTHSYDDISEGVVQTEALFELLTQIVLKDEILVDAKFTNSWDSQETPLLDLCRAKILRPVPFTDQESHFAELRSHLVDKLCVTSSLRHAQDENEKNWAESRTVTNPLLSAVLWGSAGMLARSSFFKTHYCPHPQRRRMLIEAGMLLDGQGAFDRLQQVVQSKRLNIVKGTTDKDPLYALRAILPPIPIQVINESSSTSRFIETSLALREEYRPLREWLRVSEAAIDQGSMESIHRIERELEKVGTSGFGDFFTSDGKTSISIDLSYFGLTLPINLSAVRNKFGVRAIMNRMVFGESGHKALSRYCRLLGVPGSSIEHQLFENYCKPE